MVGLCGSGEQGEGRDETRGEQQPHTHTTPYIAQSFFLSFFLSYTQGRVLKGGVCSSVGIDFYYGARGG